MKSEINYVLFAFIKVVYIAIHRITKNKFKVGILWVWVLQIYVLTLKQIPHLFWK